MDRLIGQVSPNGSPPPADDAGEGPGARSLADERGLWFRASAATDRLLELQRGSRRALCLGAPRAATVAPGAQDRSVLTLLDRFTPGDPGALPTLAALGGEFVALAHDASSGTITVATDPFGCIPVYYASTPERLVFGTDLAWVSRQLPRGRDLDLQAVYDYLFFSVVPGNESIYRGVRKLSPCSALTWREGRCTITRYWAPDFARGDTDLRALESRTLEAISGAVGQAASVPHMGCFLSGGLDSSTVSGLARRHAGTAVHAFTIGFDVPAYDESRFARLAAEHFGLELHERQIRSEDVSRCAARVINAFQEPFGNPSAIPAFLCAEFARECGVRNMIAGDGGDELFAGNERYQKQSVFELYTRLPAGIRAGLVDPLAAISARAPGPLAKLASYVTQARVPLPDRLYSYNLLARNDPASVLTRDFLGAVDIDAPYGYARRLYREPATGDSLDRMLYLDWTTTLTDNDLPKVMVTAALAGVTARFPLLSPAVVEVSTRIPSSAKLTLRTLRAFYKQAFRDVLPAGILRKSKHGFGVPVGIWINRDPVLRERVCARLDALARRGIVRPELIAELLTLTKVEHASYYGSLIWPLFALEEWLQSHHL
jgi:asparagine synthase (glutamine-hydrolysing)